MTLHLPPNSPHVWSNLQLFGPDIEWKIRLTIYHIPRIMVPVRTWQQRQQLVEYHRSHGEIIIYLGVSFKLFHECCWWKWIIQDYYVLKKKKDGIVWRPCLLGPPPHPAYINNDVHPFPQVDFLANREPLICLARPGVTWRGQDFWPTSEGMDAKCFSDQCQSVEQHLTSLKWKCYIWGDIELIKPTLLMWWIAYIYELKM